MNSSKMSASNELQVADMRFRYSAEGPDVLHIPKLSVPAGQFVSLLGASGSGKSTLLRLLADLLKSTAGEVSLPVASESRQSGQGIGMVFQNANLIPWRTARANVLLPAELGSNPTTISNSVLDGLFRLVGLRDEDTCKRTSELSGGMQMRVSLARALVLQPTTLLLDEPFAALDDLLRMQLEEEVRSIHNNRSLTTVLVTHNINEAVFMSDRVLVLGGRPSTIHADIEIDLPRERGRVLRSDSAFHRLVDTVTEALHSAGQHVGATLR